MASQMFDKIKNYYDKKLWNAKMVHNAFERGRITEEEYKLIVSEKESDGVNYE